MHEAALAIEVVRLLEAHSDQLSRVTRVVLQVGALSCVEPRALVTALQVALPGTLAEGAVLEVVAVPARARCLECGAEESPEDRITPCSACGSPRRTRVAGQELRVLTVEGVPR
jgi:hydrogenase nickel incorporation protein HypA/HybF